MEVQRWDFIVTSAMKSNAVVCNACCKQKDYVPLICVCVISNFFLKTSVSLHISVVKKQQKLIMAASCSAADMSRQHIQIRLLKLWQLALAAINSSKCSLHLSWLRQNMGYCPYSLWYWSDTYIIFLHIDSLQPAPFPLTPDSNDFQNKVCTFNSVWTDVTVWRSSSFQDHTRKHLFVL